MPEYMISNGDAPPKYARLDAKGKTCAWADESQASAFPTPELARAAFDAACQATLDKANAKLAAAKADQKIVENVRSWRGKYSYGAKSATLPILLFLPHWIHHNWANTDSAERETSFPTASRPLPGDLLDVFEAFYVRCEAGWLGRAETRSQGAGFAWRSSFAFAIPFSTREEAWVHVQNGHGNIVTASCVFTAVEPGPSKNLGADHVSCAIGAACEARDIRGAIQDSAKARLADAAATPARAASRL
jgi:hypothetical protein